MRDGDMIAAAKRSLITFIAGTAVIFNCVAAEVYQQEVSWTETVARARERLRVTAEPGSQPVETAIQCWNKLKEDFPAEWDSILQDGGDEGWRLFLPERSTDFEKKLLEALTAEPKLDYGDLAAEIQSLVSENPSPADVRWLDVYSRACALRRAHRLQTLHKVAPSFVFTTRRTLRPSFFAYTEGQSDAQNERHFIPGSELCLAQVASGGEVKARTLVSDPTGAIRDPAVSWDATRIVFAWK